VTGDEVPRRPPEPDPPRVRRLVHDLNNSMTSIIAFAHLLATDGDLPEGLRRQAGLLVAESGRLRALVDELIGLRPEPGGLTAGGDAATGTPDTPRTDPPSARGRRVLVVDDEGSIRDVLARVLARAGHEAVLCESGRQGVEIVAADPPDAILCDHRMAGMDGTAFHDQVVRLAPHLARRFAFMSGDVENEALVEFAAERRALLLGKPFDIAAVTATVETLLREVPAD
jgi:CheY-like chemotaxis protein